MALLFMPQTRRSCKMCIRALREFFLICGLALWDHPSLLLVPNHANAMRSYVVRVSLFFLPGKNNQHRRFQGAAFPFPVVSDPTA